MRFIKHLGVTGGLALAVSFVIAAFTTEPSGTGTLQLRLVDAPAPIEGIESIDIVFSFISVHASADADSENVGWITLMDDQLSAEDRTFNLLEYVNGTSAILGEAELDEGHYTQLRIGIESASITISGETSDLFIPSGAQSGLKLTGGFNIDPNVITELTLDFEGTAIGAYVLAGPDAGTVEVSIDDGPVKAINLYHEYSRGLHYPRTVIFDADLKAGGHALHLRISGDKDARSSGHALRVLHFVENAAPRP